MAERGKGYSRLVWERAYSDWRSTRDRLVWGVITAVLGFVVALFAGRQMIPTQHPLAAGLIGAVGGPLLAAFLYLVWHRFRSPVGIWADDQRTIAELTARCERLETDIVALQAPRDDAGPSIPDCWTAGAIEYSPDAAYKIYFFHLESPAQRAQFRVFCDRDVVGKITVHVLSLRGENPLQPADVTLSGRRETAFNFQFPEEYNRPLTLIQIALHPASVRITQIQQL